MKKVDPHQPFSSAVSYTDSVSTNSQSSTGRMYWVFHMCYAIDRNKELLYSIIKLKLPLQAAIPIE